MLAGISNSPNNYNPVASMELATKKKNSILNKMQECGFLTKEECKKAKEQEITGDPDGNLPLKFQQLYVQLCHALCGAEADGAGRIRVPVPVRQ